MSQVLESDARLAPASESSPGRDQSRRAVLIWCLGSSFLLVGSGLVRSVQSRIYQEEKDKGVVQCPFPLGNVPKTIGDWKTIEGSETILDPLTTRITGSTDHIIRSYVDEMTGVTLSVMILYGPADPVMPHTPQVCYPSSGFQAVANPVDRDIKIDDQLTANFRASLFFKPGGRSVIRQAVYHSFRLDRVWSPALGPQRFARKSPGIFKVQIQRRMIDGERLDQDEPIESYLQTLIPVLERMIAESAAQPTPVASR